MAGWKLTLDPDRFHGLSCFFVWALPFWSTSFALMFKRHTHFFFLFPFMLKLIKPLHALPGFPGFVTNTTVSLSHTNTGRRLVKRESKGGGIEDWEAGSKRCRAAERGAVHSHLRNKVKYNFNTDHSFQFLKKVIIDFLQCREKRNGLEYF